MYFLLQADQRLKQNQEDLPLFAHLQEPYLFVKEYGLILNQELNPIKRTLSQKDRTLFFGMDNYLQKKMEFWRLKDDLRNKFEHSQYWSQEMWKSKMAGGGGNKKRFQHCTDSSGQEILYLRALQGHSGRNPIDPTLQDNALIPEFLRVHLSYWMCNQFTLHHKFRIDSGGQNSSRERQTVFFTAVNPMNKDHKDPHELDLTKPRLAS